MVAGSGAELEENTCKADCDDNLKLVRTAAIYGPNAAGKSNIIRALETMRQIILDSAKEMQRGEPLDIDCFLFNTEGRHQPSKFEIIFSKTGIRYQYGFEADKRRIYNEWLFSFPNERTQQWFIREYDKKSDTYHYKFSTHFKGGKKQHNLWRDSTKSNTLFFSNAILLNNDQLQPIFDWFQKELKIIRNLAKIDNLKSVEMIENLKTKGKIMKLMTFADPSITDVIIEKHLVIKESLENASSKVTGKGYFSEKGPGVDWDLPVVPPDATGILAGFIRDNKRISFIHSNNLPIPFNKESDGTRKLLEIAGYWVELLERGGVLVIDEIDNSLHPILVLNLINLINSSTNKKGAQLIFSTHDTSLLDSKHFRRDQIWFVEKDQKNATNLYSLLEFSPRKHETYGKYYLQGRYGALPYIGDWTF